MLVVDDDLLHALQGLDDDVVDPLERFLDLQWRHPTITICSLAVPNVKQNVLYSVSG